MEELYEYRQGLLNALAQVVEELRSIAAGIPSQAWHTPLDPDAGTPHFLLAHLRCIEAHALFVRLRRILDEDNPVLELFNDEAWMQAHYQTGEPPQAILDDYARLRQQELAWLADLPAEAWCRTGRHPWWGVRTTQWWAEQCLAHTLQHLRQLQAASTG